MDLETKTTRTGELRVCLAVFWLRGARGKILEGQGKNGLLGAPPFFPRVFVCVCVSGEMDGHDVNQQVDKKLFQHIRFGIASANHWRQQLRDIGDGKVMKEAPRAALRGVLETKDPKELKTNSFGRVV